MRLFHFIVNVFGKFWRHLDTNFNTSLTFETYIPHNNQNSFEPVFKASSAPLLKKNNKCYLYDQLRFCFVFGILILVTEE